jgi:hypothetical protein
MQCTPDLSVVLKVAARLIDLHDSRRGYGESPNYQGDVRSGNGDGRYVALGTLALFALQDFGRRTGDEYASLEAITQAVRTTSPWAHQVDIEYTLNVLSRPTELKLLHGEAEQANHVISERDTNLVDKSPNLLEFRLSRVGRLALTLASELNEEYQEIAYIEGDVTKLIRAIEGGKLPAALAFVERLIEQLRTEHISLISLIERGGRNMRQSFDELIGHTDVMQRTNNLVKTAQLRIDELIRNGKQIEGEDVPIGLVRERVLELSRGIVRYARALSQLAGQASRNVSTSVTAPSFSDLARHWITHTPTNKRIDQLLAAVGPTCIAGIAPRGSDFEGAIKSKELEQRTPSAIDLDDYEQPSEHAFNQWIRANRAKIEQKVANGGLTLDQAIAMGLGQQANSDTFNFLVTALVSIETWAADEGLTLTLAEDLKKTL